MKHTRNLKIIFATLFFLILTPLIKANLSTPNWFDSDGVSTGDDWHYRAPLTITSGGTGDIILTEVDFGSLLINLNVTGTLDLNSVRIINESGDELNEYNVIFTTTDMATLEFALEDSAPATYYAYFDITENSASMKTAVTPSFNNTWFDSDWSHRIPVVIDYASGVDDLNDFLFTIQLDHNHSDFWNHAQSTGNDIRVVDESGTEFPIWVEKIDTDNEEATVWFQYNSTFTAGASETVYLYFGNASATSVSDQETTFTYSSAKPVAVNLNYTTSTSNITVVSYFDNNQIIRAANFDCIPLDQATLNQAGTYTFNNVNMGDVFCATKPFVGRSVGRTDDMLAPLSFASTDLILPTNRGTNSLNLYSPYADADVDLFFGNNTTAQSTTTLSQGTAMNVNANATGTTHAIWLQSSYPVLANHYASYDAYVVYPQANNLYGVASRASYMSSTNVDSFNVTVTGSQSAACSPCTINQGLLTTLKTNAGGNGNGISFYLTADHSFSAIQQSDLDGSETTTYLPYEELGKIYYVPTAAEYFSIVCTEDNTTVELTIANDGSTHSATCQSNDLVYLNAASYSANASNGSFDAGSKLEVTAGGRIYVYYEDYANNDETNLWSVKAHRQGAYPAPTVSEGSSQALGTLSLGNAEGFGIDILTMENANGGSLTCGSTLSFTAQSEAGQYLGTDATDTLEAKVFNANAQLVDTITLYDNGSNGDAVANDGIYSNNQDLTLGLNAASGSWSVVVSAGTEPSYDNGYLATDTDSFTVACSNQPDLQVKVTGNSNFSGNNSYSPTSQSVSTSGDNDETLSFTIRIENDGGTTDSYTLVATASASNGTGSYNVTYTLSGSDITSNITNAGHIVANVSAGGRQDIVIEVTPDEDVPDATEYNITVVATSSNDSSLADEVSLTATLEASSTSNNNTTNDPSNTNETNTDNTNGNTSDNDTTEDSLQIDTLSDLIVGEAQGGGGGCSLNTTPGSTAKNPSLLFGFFSFILAVLLRKRVAKKTLS